MLNPNAAVFRPSREALEWSVTEDELEELEAAETWVALMCDIAELQEQEQELHEQEHELSDHAELEAQLEDVTVSE